MATGRSGHTDGDGGEARVPERAKVWIGHIMVPHSVELKIRSRRGLTGAQVRAACEWPAEPIQAAWHDHPEYGRRLIVYVYDEQHRLLKVVLQPIDPADGSWRLRTAVVATREGA
jgi:hypothetical protein